MTEQKEPSELVVVAIICGVIFILSLAAYGLLTIIFAVGEARQHSREAQRCQVAGEEIGCVRYSAWSLGDDERCSCALDGGRRIEYRREP